MCFGSWEMLVASAAGLACYLIPAEISSKIDATLNKKEIEEKRHNVVFKDEVKQEKEKEINGKYEKYRKLNSIACIAAIATSLVIAGKAIGHLFTKSMNDLDK